MRSARIEEAKALLKALGMPASQRNDNAAFTLLAFADVGPDTPWDHARTPRLRPHDVLAFALERYGKKYAENTRETIRRNAIHQFIQGGILSRNPDSPALATNSPQTRYALTDEALLVLQAYGTESFASKAAWFLGEVGGGLAARYGAQRHAASVTVSLPDGLEARLSPGAHNDLQARVLTEFRPRFAPDTELLYLGDTDHKSLFVATEKLSEAGLPVTRHDKLPDIVLLDRGRSWLFFIEAVTSHGPISPKRLIELQEGSTGTLAGKVFVSAFASFKDFKRYASQIAWETEVWIAEAPDHLLHYNGDRFFGPR